MKNVKDWTLALLISIVWGGALLLFLHWTRMDISLSMVWTRTIVKKLTYPVLVCSFVMVPNWRQLGALLSVEICGLLLSGYFVFLAAAVLADQKVAPALSVVGLSGLPNLLFVVGLATVLSSCAVLVQVLRESK